MFIPFIPPWKQASTSVSFSISILWSMNSEVGIEFYQMLNFLENKEGNKYPVNNQLQALGWLVNIPLTPGSFSYFIIT